MKHAVQRPAASGSSRGGPLAAQRVLDLQRAAGNRAAQAEAQRQYGENPRNRAIRQNPKVQSDEAA